MQRRGGRCSVIEKPAVRERRVFVIDDTDWQLCALIEEVEDGEVRNYIELSRSVSSGGRAWQAERSRNGAVLDTLTVSFEEPATVERAVRRVLEEWPWCTSAVWEDA